MTFVFNRADVMRHILAFAVVALVLAMIAPSLMTHQKNTGSVAAATAAPEVHNSRSISLPRNAGGHFYADGLVDGRRIDFIVDTGASLVTLREGDAARLGIHPSQRDYSLKMQTANGIVLAAPVDINRVEVGDLIVRNVRAIVLPDQALAQNLLGMTFLSQVHWQYQGDRLVLDQ
jgi:aspartyl protease family protein